MDIKQLTVQGTVIANAEFLVTKNNDNFMRFKIACHNKGVSNNDTDFFTVRVFDKNIIIPF